MKTERREKQKEHAIETLQTQKPTIGQTITSADNYDFPNQIRVMT